MKLIKLYLIILICITSSFKADSKQNLINELKNGGKLIFIRNAYAPGSGDPANFDINDLTSYEFIRENKGLILKYKEKYKLQ